MVPSQSRRGCSSRSRGLWVNCSRQTNPPSHSRHLKANSETTEAGKPWHGDRLLQLSGHRASALQELHTPRCEVHPHALQTELGQDLHGDPRLLGSPPAGAGLLRPVSSGLLTVPLACLVQTPAGLRAAVVYAPPPKPFLE